MRDLETSERRSLSMASAQAGGGASQLSLVAALTVSPATPIAGQPIMVSYTVENTGGQPLTVPLLFVGARDPNNANVDFGYVPNVLLQPGQQYTCQQSHTFTAVGTYAAWPAAYLNGIYQAIDPAFPPVKFGIREASPGRLSLVAPLSVSPARPIAGQLIVLSYTVEN